jgi:AraC family transcriptional regulator of adaptative response / DNA-3-methyladenine glycosylase II
VAARRCLAELPGGPVTWYEVELDLRPPFHGEALLTFFGRHAVPGVEVFDDVPAGAGGSGRRLDYARTLLLPSGPAALMLRWAEGQLRAWLSVHDPGDLAAGRERLLALCDGRRDIVEVEARLSQDPVLRPLLAASPGLRVPGTVDLHEHLFRTLVGQQISLAGAASCAGKLVARFGEPCPGPDPSPSAVSTPGLMSTGLTHLFPTATALATADPETLPMPRARGRALVALAVALAEGSLVLEPDVEPAELRRRLLGRRGIGAWTADYVLMRGLGCPDVLLSTDLVIRRELVRCGITDPERWSPWRSYATLHLWRSWTG